MTKRLTTLRGLGVVVVLSYCLLGVGLRGQGSAHEGEDGGGSYQECEGCGCHLSHGSGCTVKHGTVCSGDSCSIHPKEDCWFVPIEG